MTIESLSNFTIANFSGVGRSGHLLLMGKYTECHVDVVRVDEMRCKWVNPYRRASFFGNNQTIEPATGQYIVGYKE